MDRVFFEGVRCFYSRQEVPLAPVTILVGENSSGKSTALALVRLAWEVVFRGWAEFNEDPFYLGAYDQVASSNGQKGRSGQFVIGWENQSGSASGLFVPQGGQPILQRLSYEIPPFTHTSMAPLKGGPGETHFTGPFEGLESYEQWSEVDLALDRWRDSIASGSWVSPHAFAPVRTRPRRTYDPIRARMSPEGEHIPTILASSALRNSDDWKVMVDALKLWGRLSGLFDGVDVRLLGESESDPFQIQVHIGEKYVNLIDVGYGVSQVLPIIVDCLRGGEGSIYLLQQPEVHLHPRAQAELGSFLAVLAKQQNKRFVIETHSDYLVDRVRMDIRDKKGITPDDVALLYFERANGEATIQRLELDDQGNILNAPPGYRSFFLEEERRFLGG